MSDQVVPPSVERCHWQVKALSSPLHAPALALRVWLRCAAPLIWGSIVLAGGELATVAVAVLAALTVPSALVAVTRRRTVEPSSATVERVGG